MFSSLIYKLATFLSFLAAGLSNNALAFLFSSRRRTTYILSVAPYDNVAIPPTATVGDGSVDGPEYHVSIP